MIGKVQMMNGHFSGRRRPVLPAGALGTLVAVGLVFLVATVFSLAVGKPVYWLFGIALVYAVILVLKRHRGSGISR